MGESASPRNPYSTFIFVCAGAVREADVVEAVLLPGFAWLGMPYHTRPSQLAQGRQALVQISKTNRPLLKMQFVGGRRAGYPVLLALPVDELRFSGL
jgi:hypothetical protein